MSADQTGHFEQGPLESSLDLLTEKTSEILDFRAANTPKLTAEEGGAAHLIFRSYEVTSQRTALSSTIGCYQLQVMGTASEGNKSSSLNYTGGRANDLTGKHACEWFAIGDMLADTQNQIVTKSIGSSFVGEIILAPSEVSDLVARAA